MIKLENVKSPFMCYCAKVIPLAFDESMSYYECLCNFYNYLKNEVMPVINQNAEATKELQELFVELKSYVDNYFENLDVQEEINNKLDDMYENGQLQSLIEQFIELSVTFTFNNLSEMQQATNLINGSFAQTKGYTSYNDGGGAYYKVRTITNSDVVDNRFIIALSDETLIAELQYFSNLNIGCLGFASDGTEDIGSTINSVIDTTNIIIPNGTYLVSTPIEVTRDHTIINCEGTLTVGNNNCINLNACDCEINIYKILGDSNIGTGIRFYTTTNNSHSIWNNNVTVNIIKSCEYGLLFNPVFKGCQYNKITFNEINCENDIVFNASNGGWVNENVFNGGRLSGNYGVHMIKGASIGDYYNGNKFLNIGFEAITHPVNLEYAIRNTFRHSRMAESLNGTYWIECDADTRLNNFENDSSLHFDKVNDLNSALTSRNTYKGYPLIWDGHYYGYDGFVINGKKFLNERPVEPTEPTAMAYGYTGEYSSPIYYNGMLVSTGCDSNGTANVTLPSVFSNAGVTNFLLRISYRGQNGSITVKDSSNNVIIDDTILGNDQYITNRVYRVTMNYKNLTPIWFVERILN